MMDLISSMTQGELFSAYSIVKAYYEVSADSPSNSPSASSAESLAAESSFFLSVPDESLLMDEQMLSAPVADITTITSSPSFYLSVPGDESLLRDQQMISAPIPVAVIRKPIVLSAKTRARVDAKHAAIDLKRADAKRAAIDLKRAANNVKNRVPQKTVAPPPPPQKTIVNLKNRVSLAPPSRPRRVAAK